MARLDVMKMNKKAPANLHKVDPIAIPDVNAAVIMIGAAAIVVIVGILFNFMMDDFNLLLLRSI